YTYHAQLSVGRPVEHTVLVPANLLPSTTPVVTFRNIATDDCGLAAVYNVRMGTNPVDTSSTVALTGGGTAVYGQPVTLTATVASAAGMPTGSVDFFDGTTLLGTVVLSGGVASFTTAALAVGSHSISAAYRGDGTVAAGTSNTLTQVIIP